MAEGVWLLASLRHKAPVTAWAIPQEFPGNAEEGCRGGSGLGQLPDAFSHLGRNQRVFPAFHTGLGLSGCRNLPD